MKKTKIFLLIIFFLSSIVLQTLNSRPDFKNNLLENYTEYSYSKQPTLSTEKFIKILDSSELDLIISINNISSKDNQQTTTYYMSKIPQDLENVNITNTDKNFSISEKKNKFGEIKLIKINSEKIKIKKLNYLKKSSFNLNNYSIQISDMENLNKKTINNLSKKGIYIDTNNNRKSYSSDLYMYLYLLATVLFIYLLILEIFSLIKNSKKMGIYKLNGIYSREFIKIKIIENCKIVLISFLIVQIPTVLFLWYQDRINLLLWDTDSLKYIFIIFIFLYFFFSLLISHIFYKKIKIVEFLKNKMNFKVLIIFLNGIKFLFTLIIGFNLIITFNAINDSIDLNKNITKYNSLDNYYSVFQNGLENDLGSDTLNHNYKEFYMKYNKELNGIFVYSGAYYAGSCFNPESKDYQSSQCYTIVNNNYLKMNPIYLANGKIFNSKNYKGHLLLVPENRRRNIKDFIGDNNINYSSKVNMNIIYIKNNQKLFSYNLQYLSGKSNLYMKNPIIYLVDEDMSSDTFGITMGNSDANYFVKGNKNLIFKAIAKSGLSKNIKEIYTKKSESSKVLGELNQKIITLTISFIINFIILIFLIIYTTKIKLLKDSKSIAVKKLNGISVFTIYKKYFIDLFIIYLVIFGMSFLLKNQNYIFISIILTPIIMFVLEVIVKIIIIYFYKKNIILELKGK